MPFWEKKIRYVGSKNKLSKDLAPIIQSYITVETRGYLEPFVGGANMIDKIKCSNRIGCDIHKQLIALLQYAQEHEKDIPERILEEEYKTVQNNKENYPDWYLGLVGFCASFGAKYFGGYARGFKADKVTPRDIPNEALRNLSEQIPNIQNIKFLCGDYKNNEYANLRDAVIYCDPPYQGTTKYATDSFDYDMFWDWCRKMSKENWLFVSEYNAPSDFECIWCKNVTTSLKVHEHESRVEKLFTYKK